MKPHMDLLPVLEGCTNEMLRLCLEDNDLFQLLHQASEDFASGVVPPTVSSSNVSHHDSSEER